VAGLEPEAVVVHTDGASRGNPGPASIGVVISDPAGRVLAEFGEALPERTTNNVAEYTAVIRGLERALQLGARRVRCQMDSQLVVRQLNGDYRVKHADMIPLHRRVGELAKRFESVSFAHVPRELNAEADRLANLALDRREGTPDETVSRLFDHLSHGRLPEAARLLGEGFQYRRAGGRDGVVDREAFLAIWEKAEARAWSRPSVRLFGADALLQAEAGGEPKTALLWLCEVTGGIVERVLEYRDAGV
jgi:ribonuclease HI